jgi:SAM-dependent MidA family methyltransferase
MQTALYEPGSGYYRRGVRKIGRAGDFYTSVSVGPLYGALLAEYAVAWWEEEIPEGGLILVEQGAHDGTLAGDVLRAIKERYPAVYERVTYYLVEPDPVLQAAQAAALEPEFPGKWRQVPAWAQIPSGSGMLLCNELLDAFPVHRLQMTTAGWQELYVERANQGGELRFVPGPMSSEAVMREAAVLGADFPEGYITEVNVAMLGWLEEVIASPFRGLLLVADYGHTSMEYYLPERHGGTLRRYFHHQSDGRVLEDLGEADLTAHVNFTRLAQVAENQACTVAGFLEQGRFLTYAATRWMREPDFAPAPAWMRQFQALTHPGHLGYTFQVLTLVKGMTTRSQNYPLSRDVALRRLGMENALLSCSIHQ